MGGFITLQAAGAQFSSLSLAGLAPPAPQAAL
jgi:hypothetical protein